MATRTTTTALLRSLKTAKTTTADIETKYADMEWNLSDKSDAAWAWYKNFYEEKIKDPYSTPSDVVTYQNKIISGQRAYVSNKIQKASIDVIEGNMDDNGKLNTLTSLYTQAYNNGDYDLAQNLRLQIDNQIVKMQNAALSGGGGGGGYGGSSSSSDTALATEISSYISDVKSGKAPLFFGADGNAYNLKNINEIITNLGENGLQDLIDREGFVDGETGQPLSPVELVATALIDAVQAATDAASKIGDPAKQAKAISDIDYMINHTKFDIGSPDGVGVTIADLRGALDEMQPVVGYDAQGNPILLRDPQQELRIEMGANGYSLKRNSITDYQWDSKPIVDPGTGKVTGYEPYIREVRNVSEPVKARGEAKFGAGNVTWFGDKSKALAKAFEQAGIYDPNPGDKEGSVQIGPELLAKLSQFGFNDTTIDKSAFQIDDSGKLIFVDRAHNTIVRLGTKPNEAEAFRGITGDQYLGGLGRQATMPGSYLQGAQAGTNPTQVLQSAANAKQLNDLKVEQLRVQEIQNRAKVAVTKTPTPPKVTVDPFRYEVSAPTRVKVSAPIYRPPVVVQPTVKASKVTVSGASPRGAGSITFGAGIGVR